jgi:hypothetical protein
MPQAGKADSPGTAVPVVVVNEEVDELKVVALVVVDWDDEVVGVEEIIFVDVEAVEGVVVSNDDDDEVEMGEVVAVESDGEVEVLATLTLVVIPSKAIAQTTVPLGPAVIGTTVSPPVRS